MRGQEIEMSNERGGDMEKARAGKMDDRGGLTLEQSAFVREYLAPGSAAQEVPRCR
jgi:hypothetical protein